MDKIMNNWKARLAIYAFVFVIVFVILLGLGVEGAWAWALFCLLLFHKMALRYLI